MATIEFTPAFEHNHAALAARLKGLRQSLQMREKTLVADAASDSPRASASDNWASDNDAKTLMVARGAVPMITRGADGRFSLTYRNPDEPGSLAAMLACLADNDGAIAADPESLSVYALAERLAASEIPVLIGGPTGTGKEILSRFIHNNSRRADKPFVAVNCAAIPETMLEAMLFGHRKGAFTGASEAAQGFFRAADGGTLLLDEIAEMPLGLQAKLLRALQEGEVTPVGASAPVKVDVRIIACANRDLPAEVAEGRFREDLYYRLNVFPVQLRPLRERPGDIAALAFAMLIRHAPDYGQAVPWISPDALQLLEDHGWPGNVRELENVIRRALVMAAGRDEIALNHIVFDGAVRSVSGAGPSTVSLVPAVDRAAGQSGSAQLDDLPQGGKLSKIVKLSEARAIMDTLEACGGKRVEAARRLGISERTLRYRLASFREAGIAIAGGRS